MKDGLPVLLSFNPSMVLERLNLITGLYLRVTLRMGKRMVMEFSGGMTIPIMMENFETMLLKAMVSTFGLMASSTKASGCRVKCVVRESSSLMARPTKVNDQSIYEASFKRTRRMARVSRSGPMGSCIMVSGRTGGCMARDS